MKKILFILPFLVTSCVMNQKISYRTDDITGAPATLPVMVEIRVFDDNRATIEENTILFNSPRQVRLDGKQTCLNSEKHYRRDTVANQVSRMMVEHFNKARLFRMTFYDRSEHSNYYLTGSLNSFYAEQEFSTAKAVGAQFGLIGALATAGVKTPGKVIIDVSDLKLCRKDGTVVKDFGSFYKEYNDDFKADSACWCAYWTANEMLKDFNSHLIEKIRNDLAEVVWE
jgi:hypothetical protein